jgi:SAM-dependent methyltransferase
MEATFSTVFLILLLLVAIQYLTHIAIQRIKPQVSINIPDLGAGLQREGFTDGSEAKEIYLKSPELYDSFYAAVYDQLTQNTRMSLAKVALATEAWKKAGHTLEKQTVLDAGCGTGIAAAAFAAKGLQQVIGLDLSPAMIDRAKNTTLQETKLTPAQKDRISFQVGDLYNPSAVAAASVDHAVLLYFTIYYIHDKETVFRNLFSWVKPGGTLTVEVVNKYKFDPMLDSAAPWIGFSLQKYAKDRITESRVTFKEFEYLGTFDLQSTNSEFRETFKFKDGRIRRQKHVLYMPSIEEIVKAAQAAGWIYSKFTDLTMIGFEYAYFLEFRHP